MGEGKKKKGKESEGEGLYYFWQNMCIGIPLTAQLFLRFISFYSKYPAKRVQPSPLLKQTAG